MFLRSPKQVVILSYEAHKKFVRKNEYNVKSFKMFLRSPKKFVILSYEARKKFVRKIEYCVKSFICF